MQCGEVWWVDLDERRLVVLLSGEEASEFRAWQVVPAADVDIGGVAAEIALGLADGLAVEGVVRIALPRPGFIPCTWLVSVSRENLLERVGVLSKEKLSAIFDLLRLGGLE
jgi:mRNA interferase MazF